MSRKKTPLAIGIINFVNESLPCRTKQCRTKFSSDKIIHLTKFSSLTKNFVTFVRRKILSIFKILGQIRLNSFMFLEIYSFFTIRITTKEEEQQHKKTNKQTKQNKTKQKNIHILFFKIYAELDLTVLIQRLSFYFWPNHFTIDFFYILIIRIVNLRWLSLLFWFHPSLSSSPSIMISVAS